MSSPTTPARRITNVDALSTSRALAPNRSRWRRTWPLLAAIVLTCGLITVSIFVGVADITAVPGEGAEFLWITRIPRTASLVLAGASMAMAGLVMQLMTQNRFVEPTTVGTTEWAGLGLVSAGMDVGKLVYENWDSITSTVGDAASSVGNFVSDTASTVSDAVGDAANTVSDKVDDVASSVSDGLGKVGDAFGF